MIGFTKLAGKIALGCVLLSAVHVGKADERAIPELLKPWETWVTWGDRERDCPTPYNNAQQHICFWPSQLTLTVNQNSASWTVAVQVFAESWVPLPGNGELWPQNVSADGKAVAVIARDGKPFVRLTSGLHQLTGELPWTEMPQRVSLPKEIGILSLVVDGKVIERPNWDAGGDVWLKRQQAAEAEKDFLAARVYRVIEDGVPMWLRTEVELTVSGKSREESLGWVLPEGWHLSFVDSPIPVALDEQGQLKCQVRAGKWSISIDAFRTTDPKVFRYPDGAKPLTDTELIAWKSQSALRSAEISGIRAVDVTQTTFPAQWRGLPVYEWKTDSSFTIKETMRGMGELHPEGLTIRRRLWLDDDGLGLTYRDSLNGRMQQIWRLDATGGAALGAVRIDGEGQLVTANPKTGEPGVEIRNRNLNMEAIGRVSPLENLLATGWSTGADSLQWTLMLPPGWRVLALFGADGTRGDWLTAWTLLDLFLLLIFSMAVLRLWGFKAGLVALLAFALAYHERGAPRYTWLFLLIPLALLTVVPEGTVRRFVVAWRNVALVLLALCLIPFLAMQVQTAIYPQLERPGVPYTERILLPMPPEAENFSSNLRQMGMATRNYEAIPLSGEFRGEIAGKANLMFEATSKIQTGPAEPDWTWNQVSCEWNGPVSADQQIRLVLITPLWHRLIIIARVVLLIALVAILLKRPGNSRQGLRSIFGMLSRRAGPAAGLITIALLPGISMGQTTEKSVGPIPDQQMLNTLRERLLETSDAYPEAAEIASTKLQLRDARITIESEIHAAIDVAVPLPGRLPTWSPLSVKIDDNPSAAVVCRREGYLWAIVPKGVHKVIVEGTLSEGSEWEWTFLLKPRRISIDAPDWTVTGVTPNGTVEQQVFFARKQKATESQAAYDRKDFSPIVAVQRQIEAGLVWKVHNQVTRLSSPGRAISLKLPLLPGESVLTSNVVGEGGQIEVRLAAGETSFQWDSDLSLTPSIHIVAQNNDQWVERWQLVASPVWDVALAGIAPMFAADQQQLIPTWQPWSGEEVTLTFTQPKAVTGETITVQNVQHEIALGDRQRTGHLKLDVECSLASDFPIALGPNAEITSLALDGTALPVRREGENLVVPVHPGHQSIEVAWRSTEEMNTVAEVGPIALPVDGANITTTITVPDSRWVLWAEGPRRGPAVRFWSVLAIALLSALALGSTSLSPLRRFEWVLLGIGLTQVNVVAAIVVVAWLFLLAWRGKQNPELMSQWRFNQLQVALVILTFASLAILVFVASKGLLGQPEMFIVGNNSSRTSLQWFLPRAGQNLPEPFVVSISVWYYRFAMLAWALWLAAALLRWLAWGWMQFTHGGGWKPAVSSEANPAAQPKA